MNILIINGSHRKGNTDQAIEKLRRLLEDRKNTVRILTLREIEMKLPDGCEHCAESDVCPNVHDEFSERIEPTIRSFDAYIIATPIWSDGITPLTKIFWDRIVSWCHHDRMYLKGKKLAIMVHGMADETSWHLAIDWAKGICSWEGCIYAGSLAMKSGSPIDSIHLNNAKMEEFVQKITS